MANTKTWYQSKTILANILAAVVLFAANEFGYEINQELQGLIVMVGNIILRLVTKDKVVL